MPPKPSPLRRHEKRTIETHRVQGLRADHPALSEARTIFPSTVIAPEHSPRLLVSGINSVKIGARVTKGAWRGFPIYTLTLEERATCPRSCHHWSDCYGNAMHHARRHTTDDLMPRLHREVADLAAKHAGGFVVRLHVLGDFYSEAYVHFWKSMLRVYRPLHVFGYSAHEDAMSVIGRAISRELDWPGRCTIRFSRERIAAKAVERWQARGSAITIDSVDEVASDKKVIVCPAQTGDTECCATCGLCWSGNALDKTIAFLRHGKKRPSVRGMG